MHVHTPTFLIQGLGSNGSPIIENCKYTNAIILLT